MWEKQILGSSVSTNGLIPCFAMILQLRDARNGMNERARGILIYLDALINFTDLYCSPAMIVLGVLQWESQLIDRVIRGGSRRTVFVHAWKQDGGALR